VHRFRCVSAALRSFRLFITLHLGASGLSSPLMTTDELSQSSNCPMLGLQEPSTYAYKPEAVERSMARCVGMDIGACDIRLI